MGEARPLVLYIDDDVALARLVQRDLGRHGFAVETAPDGATGLARLRQGGVDVVALDHYMPGQDGLEILAALRDLPDPPPVVYVTGTSEGRVAVAALKAGAVDYVIKEVQGEFFTLLRAALSAAIAARELRRAREAAEAELRASRDRFEALANEREILLHEVNHRVGNSLQLVATMLNMQASASRSQEVRDALAAATSRVSAVAQVHRRLYTSAAVQAVDLQPYLAALIGDIERALDEEGGGHRLTLTAVSVPTTPDRAVALGVIVTELVINAMKYAYPGGTGPIRVSLAPEPDGMVVLAVEDDGVGSAEAAAAGSGLGRQITQAMAAKLGATLEQDRHHRGTRMVLRFAPAAG